MDQLLSIQPEKIIKFVIADNKYESSIVLTNTSSVFVAFKIRINNQSDYFVKPSIGVLRTGNSVTLSLSTGNGENIPDDKVQILAGPISINEDVIEYFKKQQRFNQHILKCTLENISSIQTSVVKSTLMASDIDDFKSTIKTQYQKPSPKMQQSKDMLLLEKIQEISEEIKVIKEKQNQTKFTIGIKQFMLSILISVIIGVYIAYK